MKLTAWWSDQATLKRYGLALIRGRLIIALQGVFVMFAMGLWPFALIALAIIVLPLLLRLRYNALEKRVRPRFGVYVSEDGEESPIVFYPHPTVRDVFCAYHAADESPVFPVPGAKVLWDDIRKDQQIAFGVPREDPE